MGLGQLKELAKNLLSNSALDEPGFLDYEEG
jgi:hypothetical protein